MKTNRTIDKKISLLRRLTDNFLFIEYYSHTNCEMYKILNEHTKLKSDKWVLCKVSEGIEKAIDIAIEQFLSNPIAIEQFLNNPLK